MDILVLIFFGRASFPGDFGKLPALLGSLSPVSPLGIEQEGGKTGRKGRGEFIPSFSLSLLPAFPSSCSFLSSSREEKVLRGT
jgi:hypothetical protein